MRVALVHDWLVAQRGGENVLLELCRLFPEAPVYTLVHQAGSVHPDIEAHPIIESFVGRLPGGKARFRRWLPLFFAAAESFDLGAFDLVISTSHCVAKGVVTRPSQTHVSYVHTPMRYVWDQMPHYLARLPAPARAMARLAAVPMRRWDTLTGQRPDLVVANSDYVRRRIARVWARDALVVHPPVDVDYFAAARERPRKGFLVVSALVPYKRVELAVEVANARRLPLTIIGDGPERARLEDLAGSTVELVGAQDRAALREAYAGAEALLFPAEEDFGIVPVEAMAAGCPVIAYAEGGATETVVGQGPDATGVLFPWPRAASLSWAIDRFRDRRDRGRFGRAHLEQRARRFDRRHFVHRFAEVLREAGIGHEVAVPFEAHSEIFAQA